MDVHFESDNIENIYENVNMYYKEQQLIIKRIDQVFTNISAYYRTNNTNKLQSATTELSNNLKTINNNILGDSTVLLKTLGKYQRVRKIQMDNIEALKQRNNDLFR